MFWVPSKGNQSKRPKWDVTTGTAHNSPEELLDSPLLFDTKPIVAWRVWYGNHDEENGFSLWSVTYPVAWPSREPAVAGCRLAPDNDPTVEFKEGWMTHYAPALTCHCGFYAKKDLEGTRRWGIDGHSRGVKILGRVSLWGRVLNFTEGYRAQYAYPYELWVPKLFGPLFKPSMTPEEFAEGLRTVYGVDVQIGAPDG